MAHGPIPRRDVERTPRPNNAIKEYTLPPEELEEIRRRYPAPENKGSWKRKPPINIKTGGARDMAKEKEGPDSGLTKREFLEESLKGATVAAIERGWGMKVNTLPHWVKKWGVQGISPEEAKRLLAEMDAAPKLPAEPPEAHGESGETEAQKPEQRIYELLNERDRLASENNDLHTRLANANNRASEAEKREREANTKIGEYIQAIRELEERAAELESYIAAKDEPEGEPAVEGLSTVTAESEQIDELISTLSRARWILGRVAQ